ncbi:PhoU domain-containing protein [Mycoplasma crocodyli]|uniref:Putative phosphate uptake regulator PhoU n=1 Tax=Mycoplasma crocodyli (strain ATCC 51981 / MP145) TaxID=512564 RepID=D5E5S4_MYCCM|nr:PhoU domain-containing protein [Mycoplasma crocodyli]ADE19349.1 putative phosphate uptake regulator PhoU [Mycoplasma crocodyli MP145]
MNYDLLKEEEKILKSDFMKYFEHSISMHKLIKEMYKSDFSNEKKCEEFVEEVNSLETKSNHIHAILLEDAVWFISKETPKANHLRFVIGIINSIFDLERICDHAQRIALFKARNKTVSIFMKETVVELENNIENFSNKIYEALLNFKVMNVYNQCIKDSEDFFLNYKNKLYSIYNEIDSMDKSKNGTLIDFVTVLKNLDRTVDHFRNILENFVFINNPDFFVRNKKID